MIPQYTGGSAFPFPAFTYPDADKIFDGGESGMTLRQYAAIKLKVPDSGTEWLDKLIEQSLRDDFAAKAMPSCINNESILNAATKAPEWLEGIANASYAIADAMIQAREA
jgi:hypothetical protein